MKRMILANILTSQVVTFSPDTLMSQALEVMVNQQLSSLIVVDNDNKPIGIFTERDSLRLIAGDIDVTLRLGDVASAPPFTAHYNDEVHDVYVAMSGKGYRHLIVVDDEGKLAGVVTEGDFLRYIGFDALAKVKRVADVMTKSVVMLERDATVACAAIKMTEHFSEYAVIVDKMCPIGLLTERDILRYVASNSDLSVDPVWRVYQTSFHIITEEFSLPDAASIMEQHSVHQVIIADKAGQLVGVLTRHNLLQALHGSYFEFLIRQIDSKTAALTELKDIYAQLLEDKKQISKSEAKFHVLFELLHEGIVLVDAQTQLPVEFNAAAAEQLGYTREEFSKLKINDYDAIEAKEETVERIAAVIKKGGRYDFETQHKHKNGSLLDVLVSVSAIVLDNKVYALAYFRNITEYKENQSQLEYIANYDALTGLANRNLLQKQLQVSVHKANYHEQELALVIFDLDRFKDVNDSFGHSSGDSLLNQVAERITHFIQYKYLISRIGGDEFAIVIDDFKHPREIAVIVDGLISALSQVYHLADGIDVHITSSAGIALFPEHGTTAELLIQHADAALYRAKSEGRNTYRYYDDVLTQLAHQRITMEAKLRHAIINNELCVFYQPQVHIATGRIIGAEALVRWQHPIEGMIFPDAFIPLAEETGLINLIGEYVLRETCRQGKIWLEQGHHLTLAVNVSPHQIWHQDVPLLVSTVLKETGYKGSHLELELTESALMQREEKTVAILHALRAMDIKLAIDDFGTGYSSLSYLKRFPLDVLKIDKSFVDEIPFNKDDVAIVNAIIAMAKALGFSVLAEGVERIEQIDFLREQGCDFYQGYYMSRPVCAEAFEKLLIENIAPAFPS